MSDNLVTKLANPAPLGLLGFGVTTVLLNLVNAGAFPLDTMILAMGIAYGGLAQVIVGIMEFRKGNTFGTVAFMSYGLFWWSLVMLLVLPKLSFLSGFSAPSATSMAAYFLMWGIFTFAMFFGTLKANRALQFVFMSLTILFFMLTISELTNNPVLFGNVTFNTITGIEGVICGLSAVYLGIAEILNEANHKTVLPIYPTS
ncbi:MAG: acetate uptake transporter [Candidatus Bathyarchaeia archaeon]|jgi:succinate-acetate transporter protein